MRHSFGNCVLVSPTIYLHILIDLLVGANRVVMAGVEMEKPV